MILIQNVRITNHKLGHYDRHLMPHIDRLDVFKYTLASYAVLPLTEAYIFFELDSEWHHREQELRNWITDNFKCPTFVENKRKMYQPDWQSLFNTISNREPVWWTGNDDHLFIDSTLDRVIEGEGLLNADPGYASMHFSHYPELIKAHSSRKFQSLGVEGSFCKFKWGNVDGIQCLKRNLLDHWYFDSDLRGQPVPRSDWTESWPYMLKTPYTEYSCIMEIGRHFDGYSHVGCDANACPPFFIPPGFWENDVKIRFGYDDYKEGWVNCNPAKDWHRAIRVEGTDAKWLPIDIPLFWQSRISEQDINKDANWTELSHRRNSALVDKMMARNHSSWVDMNHLPSSDLLKPFFTIWSP